jgi:hypothetical protein
MAFFWCAVVSLSADVVDTMAILSILKGVDETEITLEESEIEVEVNLNAVLSPHSLWLAYLVDYKRLVVLKM